CVIVYVILEEPYKGVIMCAKSVAFNRAKPSVLKSVADLVGIAGHLPPSSVIVPGGDRVDDLQLVEAARDNGIVDRIILVGDREEIRRAISEVGIDIGLKDIVATGSAEETAAATVSLIKSGEADIVLKGNISTPIINRALRPLAVRSTVSLATIFDAAPISSGRPMILTDAGFTTICNFGRMVDLIKNAVDLAQIVMGIKRPRVAILSANEKQITSLASTRLGAQLTRRKWAEAIVSGPLSFDLATDPESVAMKGVPSSPAAREVAGRADILVCPSIDTANVLYKTISALNKYGQASLAGITVGFPFPYIILSRSDTLETRLESIALCNVFAQRVSSWRTAHPAPAKKTTRKGSRILVYNPGSTSIKMALFESAKQIRSEERDYSITSSGSREAREKTLVGLVGQAEDIIKGWGIRKLDAISARGGFLPRPPEKLSGGVYRIASRREKGIVVDNKLISAALDSPEKNHAANFGIPVAAALARKFKVPAYTVDPVMVDEFSPEAEISGYAGIVRRSTAHVLSIKAAARKAAGEIGRPLEDINLVVAHLGGGITIAAVRGGKITDDTIALLGEGPFSPVRSGRLPMGDLIDLCYSDRFSHEELIEELTERGGLRSYLGEDRMEAISERIDGGDKVAKDIVRAMIYQIAKDIGAMFVAAGCDVEGIVLTGGLTRSQMVRTGVRKQVNYLAPVMVFQGSLEMEALAAGAGAVLSGEMRAKRYPTG
ncbi:MAG: butyrate kinase, partial [Candidatus Auribacterota bacterium]|nr:butyrate kinase [Candidatus Auribacterota bacterium]